MPRIGRFLLLLLLLPAVSFAVEKTAVPALSAPVMDEAQMLTQDYRAQLNQQLLDYAHQSGSQIVVLTVVAISPETPLDYGTRVFDQWEIGRKGIDDGVLLLIVRDERKTQILVGRGLESAIPDAYAKRILDQDVMPRFRAGDVDGGVGAAVMRLQQLIAGENLPQATTDSDSGPMWMILLPVALFFAPPFAGLLSAALGRLYGSALTGGLFGVLALLSGLSLLFAVFFAGLTFVFLLVWTLVGGVSGGHGGGGHGGGGHGGGGHGGGGFGGGGFSGGGGGFGGGGASGGW